MKKEKMEARLEALKLEKTKLIKVKSASPMDIIERTRRIDREMADLQSKLAVVK